MLRERTTEYGSPDLQFLLEAVPFVIVGGLATRLYMPERMTLDVDILIVPEDIEKAEAALSAVGYKKKGPLSIGGSIWKMEGRRPIDLLVSDAPWVKDALAHPVGGRDHLPYIALPYLVLMKLESGRLQDLADISRMLGAAAEEDIEQSRRTVARYLPRDIEDVESMIKLGRLEYI